MYNNPLLESAKSVEYLEKKSLSKASGAAHSLNQGAAAAEVDKIL